MKHTFILLIILSMFTGCAKQHLKEIQMEAEKSAIYNAEKDVSDELWIAYGLSCNFVSIIHANISAPEISPKQFVGKSPEYVHTYTKSYHSHLRKKQVQSSSIGFLINSLAISLILLIRS